MIITTKKDTNKLLQTLDRYKSFYLIGCSECAALCGTGNEEAIKELTQTLTAAGKTVTGGMVPKTGCQTLGTKIELKKDKDACNDAEVIIVMSCGAGTQSAVEIFPDKPVYPSNDSLFLGNMTRFQMFDERCSLCGDCILELTGGICPVTNCPKGLLNGPCGGMKDGNCEVSADIPCAWIRIYERQKKLNELEKMDEIAPPKDWSKSQKPHSLYNKKEDKKKDKTASSKEKENK
ncbi:MAG: methylenetetrahydrofolate reductase C-terminal domain-containing protein [Candidatus Magnetobacterium sp. LHC-1]|uniref:Methylenetetrahydrofolate reductase C-terminal domain-containing protein n=1 Tax=Candidatus Magnetobacterium casense TaxID=1455061 RepID=A0ABS6RYU8_9BACT|nr:methylenetetrahydrofolate reductase C-terminal domain-containing protein [Candidatus Magnetobacterium casensis]MBF0339196.1 methylenetetrahydrofolate reductase C-terminal domain-containing protein [Nitrospirota bacterium]MBF0607953.1 methylenetetrahydrofolate reductase C-terminal domain-containing protein [Nitrospirota bacterium]MBV6341819.1 methylenetetrahydrofolate reductase C-terminal domain-containing protein [Candidatus Magnetobacterium casensis]